MSTVLIVDDTAVAREPLAKLLRYEGFDTACATNGVEALETVRSRHVDLVLLDVMMPRMDGVKFLEALRSEEHGKKVPVILLTGSMDDRQVARASRYDVRAVFRKASFTMDELSACIHVNAG